MNKKIGRYIKEDYNFIVEILSECKETDKYFIKYNHPKDDKLVTQSVKKENVDIITSHDLQKGDKFIARNGKEYTVIAKEYEEFTNNTHYFVKRNSYIGIVISTKVHEIIY